jgi:serine/threonine kinase PknH
MQAWQPPTGPHPTPPRKVNPWLPIGAIAGVLILVLGSIGIWAATKEDSPSTPPTPTASSTTTTEETTTEETTTTDNNTYERRLINMLPPGYSSTACKPVDPVPDALATVDCTKNSTPGGPAASRYSIFSDVPTLNKHFDQSIKEDQLTQCPGSGIESPTQWHYNATPTKQEGQIACGTYQNNPDVVWTKESDFLLGDVQGPKLDELHQWWLQYG